jgi:hypothetical protein
VWRVSMWGKRGWFNTWHVHPNTECSLRSWSKTPYTLRNFCTLPKVQFNPLPLLNFILKITQTITLTTHIQYLLLDFKLSITLFSLSLALSISMFCWFL